MKRLILSAVQDMNSEILKNWFKTTYGLEFDRVTKTINGLNAKYSGNIACYNRSGFDDITINNYRNLLKMLGKSNDYILTRDDAPDIIHTIKSDFKRSYPECSIGIKPSGDDTFSFWLDISVSSPLTDAEDISKACTKGVSKIVKSTKIKCDKALEILNGLIDYSEGNIKLTQSDYDQISENLDNLISYIDINLIDKITDYKDKLKYRVR